MKTRDRLIDIRNSKRKAIEELSQNSHIIKSRRYIVALKIYNSLKARLRKIYNINLSAISTIRNKIKKIDIFKNVDFEK